MANAKDLVAAVLANAAFALAIGGCATAPTRLAIDAPTAAAGVSDSGTAVQSGAPPSVYGSRLAVPPGESAAARALALTDELAASKAENDSLAETVRELKTEIENKDKALARATAEVAQARSELARARSDLERRKTDLVRMRDKLDAADKENLATLQTTVALLQQLLATDNPPAGMQP